MEVFAMKRMLILAMMFVLLSSFAFAACPDGMVSYWTFDNETVSGSTVQDFYGSNDGSINGATVGVEGMVGEAFGFDGNDFVDMGGQTGLDFATENFSISVWVKPRISGERLMILSKMQYEPQISGYFLDFETDNTFRFGTQSTGLDVSHRSTDSSYDVDIWHHVVGVKKGAADAVHIYVNGNQDDGSLQLNGKGVDDVSNTANFEVSQISERSPNLLFEGEIDEVAIFNRALNATEVAQLYNQSSQGYDYCGTYKNTLPLSSKFTEFPSTTNFSQVENLSAVENLTLGSPHGTISFGNNTVNAENQDYNKNIVFGDCFVAVNTSGLDYTFNATAYLLMNNSDGHCGDDTIFVTSQMVADAGAVKTGAKICTDCKTISVGGDSVTFRVPHFSSYAIGSNSNITIDADDPQLVNKTVTFTAIYRNSSSGDFISGANCQIDLPSGSYAMSEGTQQYIYQTSFEQNATYEYNVTCSKTGYNTLLVDDTFQILPAGEAVPEFSAIAIILLIAGLLFVIHSKRKYAK